MKDKSRRYAQKTERASGDLLLYFITHNIISGLLFFFVTLGVGIYDQQQEIYGLDVFQIFFYLFSSMFWVMTLQAIFILFLCCVAGRITAFYGIKGYYWYIDRDSRIKRTIKRWSELNKGINRFGIRWFLTTAITAVIYCMGAVSLLSNMVFNEDTLLPLMVIYILVKIAVYFFVKWLVGSKS